MDAKTPTSKSGGNESILLRDDREGVATLTLNRPEKYNALSEAMLLRLQEELDAIAGDAAVRVVVLAANGPAFCAGHDLREIRASDDKSTHLKLFNTCSRMMLTMTRIPQPVIARVQGQATAAGCQLVATADLAVASSEAKFATSGINLGLFCSTPGVAVSRNLARKHAFEMLITGEFIDAKRAVEIGLVNHAVPPQRLDAAVAELAAKITAKTPVAVTAGKGMYYKQLEMGLADAYAFAAEVMAENMQAGDTKEGIDAFLEKRAPEWEKP